MPSEDELLQAVLSDPDADEPRLAFADWCDTQDGGHQRARAEFIRAQIEILRLGDDDTAHERRMSLRLRSQALEIEHHASWAGRLADLVDDFDFDRGFIEGVTLSASSFVTSGPQILQLAPVRHLKITQLAGSADEFFACEALAGIRSLDLSNGGVDDAIVEKLAASSNLGALRWLSLSENPVGQPGVAALADAQSLHRLEYATFQGCPVDPCEQAAYDNELVADRWIPPAGERLEASRGRIAWLHRFGDTVSTFHANRYRMGP